MPVTIAVVRNECSIGSDVSSEFSNRFQQFSLLLTILLEVQSVFQIFHNLGDREKPGLDWIDSVSVSMEGCHRDRVLEGNIVDQDQLRRPLGPWFFPVSYLQERACPAEKRLCSIGVIFPIVRLRSRNTLPRSELIRPFLI